MRILCGISGIDFNVDHFPGFLANREVNHPIFSVPQKRLLSYTGTFFKPDALTPTDKYLLFLALLHSSELVEWRLPVVQTPATQSIISRNFEPLVHTLCKINSVDAPSVVFPRFIVGVETRNLANVHFWIDNWKECYKEFLNGYRSTTESQKLIRRETALERLIKNPHKSIGEYASQLADWAVSAGDLVNEFKQQIPNPLTGKPSSLADYWRVIIIRCAKNDRIYSIPKVDIEEIIEYYESELDTVGSIYSHELLKCLRAAHKRHGDYLGLDLGSATYEIVGDDDNVMAGNLKLMIDLAPETEPQKKDYPDTVTYMRAKMRYMMAQQQLKLS